MRLPEDLESMLEGQAGLWLVTGVAGFIGSNLLEALLERNQLVRGLDNFSTGHARNLEQVRTNLTSQQWAGFEFLQSDIRDLPSCQRACSGARLVLHQAALGSVPASIADPIGAHTTNATGALNILWASHQANVQRVVYASSCAVYGDCPSLPITEGQPIIPLSPYAATKSVNELYAQAFARSYGLSAIGLRYFNIFGPRQDPQGPYAAVIPAWVRALLRKEPVCIHGDGNTSRDFCYVANVVQANLRAALTPPDQAANRVYNIGQGERATLNQLFLLLRDKLAAENPSLRGLEPVYGEARPGDIRHSQADLSEARHRLGYRPHYRLDEGLEEAMDWYKAHLS